MQHINCGACEPSVSTGIQWVLSSDDGAVERTRTGDSAVPVDTLCDPGRTSREHFVIPVGHVLPHKELYASGASG